MILNMLTKEMNFLIVLGGEDAIQANVRTGMAFLVVQGASLEIPHGALLLSNLLRAP